MASRKQRERQGSRLKVSSGARNPKSRSNNSIVTQGYRSERKGIDLTPYLSRHLPRKEFPTRRSPNWTIRKFKKLSKDQRDTYFRAKRIVDEVRQGKSATQAERDNKTTLATAHKYFPGDLFKKHGGQKWQGTPSDRHPNEIQYLGSNGYEPWTLRGSREVSRYASYLSDVKRFLRGDADALTKWHGKKIGGRDLLTDGQKLTQLGNEGKLDFGDELEWRS